MILLDAAATKKFRKIGATSRRHARLGEICAWLRLNHAPQGTMGMISSLEGANPPMSAEQLGAVLRRLILAERTAEEQSDRQLLDHFIATKDEAAFTALLERHGRLVFGVCRSVLQQEQDAE